MRHYLRVLLAAVLLLTVAASAGAATIQDLIKLKAAGLSDDILIALIESDGSNFQLKADDVIALRKQGLSEKVIMAMLATSFKRPAAPPAAAPPVPTQTRAPVTVNIGDGASTAPQAYGEPEQERSTLHVDVPQPAAPPVVINVTQRVEQRVEPQSDRYAQPIYSTYPYYSYVGAPVFVPPVAPVAPPVYWGFGGQLRPGSWKPTKR